MPHAAVPFTIFAGDLSVPSWAVGFIAVLTALIGALSGVLAMYWKYRQSMREMDGKDALDSAQQKKDQYTASLEGWKCLAAEYEAQSNRREKIMQSQQLIMEALQKENVECREASAEQRQAIYFLYDQVKRLHAGASERGIDPGPLPELPPMRDFHPNGAAAFLARQTEYSTVLVHEGDVKLQEQKANLPSIGGNSGPHEPHNENPPSGK